MADPERPPERRLHERHDAWLPFQIEGRPADRFSNDYIENLSMTGAYVRTLEPLPMRTRLKIAIVAPRTRRSMQFDAEVMRVVEPEQSASVGLPPGMGISFLDLGSGDPRPRVVEILQELHAMQAERKAAFQSPPQEMGATPAPAASAPAEPAKPAEATERIADEKMSEMIARLDQAVKVARTQNYYELLGVDPAAATPAAVKKHYHRRSKEFHPDRFHRFKTKEIDQKVEELYGLLTRAYETLRDPKKREAYDKSKGIRATVEFRRAAAKARFDEAVNHIGKRRLFAATIGLKVALTLDPGNPDFQRKLEEVERQRKFFVT